MTTKILSGTYAAGYVMVPPTTEVSITPAGYVEGSGVASPSSKSGAYTVVNQGRIKSGGFGVYLYSGGMVTNGATNIGTAQISGGIGVIFGEKSGTLVNFGSIQGLGTADGGAEGNGVILSQGGAVTNGSVTDTEALIAGATAVSSYGSSTIANFVTLAGTASPPDGRVVYMGGGGSLTNGSAKDTAAFIGGGPGQGYIDAIDARRAAATVTNYGQIFANQSAAYTNQIYSDLSTAIDLEDGGLITNGTPADAGAYIYGTYGVVIRGARGTVANDGTVHSYFNNAVYTPPSQYYGGFYTFYIYGAAVSLAAGGVVDNGTPSHTKATLFGAQFGVAVTGGAGTVHNFGTILATAATLSTTPKVADGVYLAAGGVVTNGGPTDHTALIEGGTVGVLLKGAGEVANYGTIKGATAVRFTSSAAKLVVEAGSVFEGQVYGAGGTLDLACGAGSIAQLEAGDVSVHGALPSENFFDFETLEIAAGTTITLDGTGSIGAGGTTELDLVGELIVTGSLTTGGKVIGAGTLSLQGGKTSFGAGTSLTVAHVAEGGAATQAFVDMALTYAGAWAQAAGEVTVDSGDKLTFTGSADSVSGTLNGAGTLTFSGGADTLAGATLSVAHQSISNAAVTLSGAVTLGGDLTVTTASLIVEAAGATLSGGGVLNFTNHASNSLHGAGATATLTNANDRIQGAGQLGGGAMILVNDAGATIDGDDSSGLVLDTGAQTIVNGGLIEATGSGSLTIQSAVHNAGTLYASGKLTVNGGVSGAGVVKIAGGTADFAAAFTENVTFTAAGGVLELARSRSYAGQISGFAKTPVSSLDLADIAYGGATKATFSGTSASGVLTVTDGTHTAHITLLGNYTASTFTVASDGHGGTTVTDPAAAPAPAPSLASLVSALAGFGRREGATSDFPDVRARTSLPLLVRQS